MEFDLPTHFQPEFPPPIFLTTRPDLGDVSQGKLLSIKNYYDIMHGIVTPVQMQNIFDFPPAPKLTVFGKLDPDMATEQEMLGQEVFFGKGKCAACHPAPFYLDDKMHDLKVDRFSEIGYISAPLSIVLS